MKHAVSSAAWGSDATGRLVVAPRPPRSRFQARANRPRVRSYKDVRASCSERESLFGWNFDDRKHTAGSTELPVATIRRPLQRTRSNNQEKVQALMESIEVRGLVEPIDVLEVDGKYYGFSGCHRFEAFQRLQRETIPCRVRKATEKTLRQHMM